MSTTTPKDLLSSHKALITSFCKHSVKLLVLLDEAKACNNDESKQEKLTKLSEHISKIDNEPSQRPATLPKDIIHGVLKKIRSTLEEVTKLIPENDIAKNMGQKIDDAMKISDQASSITTPSESPNYNQSSSSAECGVGNSIPFPWRDHDDLVEFNQKEAYEKLDEKQKMCLSFCCGLLPHNDKNSWVEISRRELIHWWMGLKFIQDPYDGEKVLAKLVEDEFIINKSWCTFCRNSNKNTNVSSTTNSYIMHASTLSKIIGVPVFMRRTSKSDNKGNHKPVYMVKRDADTYDGTAVNVDNDDEIKVLINRGINVLTKENLDKFFTSKNVEILHLGSWPYDPASYVSVEGIQVLKSYLERTGQNITSLSLRGVAGIGVLPDSIFKIATLKVLDLKACPNLEKMPKNIALLKNLTHLDLSECYLLDHIPKGITELSELQVLKGFIIKPSLQCSFNDLFKLQKLIKLAVRAKVMNFPTAKNLETLSKMQQLKKLKVTWVLQTSQDSSNDDPSVSMSNDSNDAPKGLPASLEKLELKAAYNDITASRFLDFMNYDTSSHCPEKLYIIGGGLQKFDLFKYRFLNVQTLRLRHLRDLRMKWSDCSQLFPNLSHLEVLHCPNLVFFPIDDNGMWDKSEGS